jgi:hypothetical protein
MAEGLYTAKLPVKGYELVWEERGPRNVGGRTRTIMPDPNDPDNKKLWAGSVSGGLWLINNIDSIDYHYIQDNDLKLESLLNPIGKEGSLLNYSFPESGRITLNLYSLTGQLIETIVRRRFGSWFIYHQLETRKDIQTRDIHSEPSE